ncbi:MAG TPA: DNA-directed RNA polymerase subunit K [Candidatus Thermoplasmatota archaeon]|nr:DNA-directed RNA polymerase subunit K [Candidatus Thermoplasmatota archaeon]
MEYTRFERARIVGARALQIALGAPVLVDHPVTTVNPVDLSLLEYRENVIPITVRRTVPPKAEPRKLSKAMSG